VGRLVGRWDEVEVAALVMMNSRLPNQMWEPGVRLMLPLATGDVFVKWR
jgi:hypothetical protein